MRGEREIHGHGFNGEPRLSPPDSESGQAGTFLRLEA